MKALSLSRPLLIMIIGLPGAGKSFFARHFADTFNAPLVSSDLLRFELFDKPNYTPNEQGLIRRIIERQVAELVKTKSSLVIDGLCNTRPERQAWEQFAAGHGYGTMIVWVQTDEPTAKSRSLSRNAKRPGDEYNQSITQTQFTTFAKQYMPPTRTEDYVVISGKHTYSTQARMVLRKLAAPRVEKADEAYQKETGQARRTAPERPLPNSARRNVIIR